MKPAPDIHTPPAPPRISIIVRTKDRPRFLARALRDVLAQSETRWELFVVNDAGDPAAVEQVMVEASVSDDRRVRALHLEVSRGMEAASNAALAHCTAPYVTVHDDDDTWAPDFLSATLEWLEANSAAEAVVAATDIVFERIEGLELVEYARQPWRPPHDMISLFDLLLVNRFVPIGTVIRRRVLDELGGFAEELPVVGDWALHMKLAVRGEIGYLPGPARAFWRQRPESSGTAANSVFSGHLEHLQFDRRVRDEALREYIEREGLGLPLLLTRFVDERARELLDERLGEHLAPLRESLELLRRETYEHARHYSPGETIARNLRRVIPKRWRRRR